MVTSPRTPGLKRRWQQQLHKRAENTRQKSFLLLPLLRLLKHQNKESGQMRPPLLARRNREIEHNVFNTREFLRHLTPWKEHIRDIVQHCPKQGHWSASKPHRHSYRVLNSEREQEVRFRWSVTGPGKVPFFVHRALWSCAQLLGGTKCLLPVCTQVSILFKYGVPQLYLSLKVKCGCGVLSLTHQKRGRWQRQWHRKNNGSTFCCAA